MEEQNSKNPADFLRQAIGRPVVVKLSTGVEYKGYSMIVNELYFDLLVCYRGVGLSRRVYEHSNGAD